MEAQLAKRGPRGGARPGSGPKPRPDAMVTRAFVIRKDQLGWIEERATQMNLSKSEIVRYAIDEFSRGRKR